MPAQNTCPAWLVAAVGALLASHAGAATVPTPISPRTIGGTVSGLTGLQLILQLNGQNDHEINSNGDFVFPRTLSSGAQYTVTLKQQPHDPAQTCTVANGRGIVPNSNVSTVQVECAGAGPAPPPPAAAFARFAYVRTEDAVSVYAVDGATGRLRPRGYVPGPGIPGGFDTTVVVDPTGRFAYAAHRGPSANSSGFVTAYTVDPVSGELTAIPNSTVSTPVDPMFIATGLGGRFIYVLSTTSNAISVYRINQIDGRLLLRFDIPTLPYPASIVFDSADRFAYVANKHANSITTYSVNSSNGMLNAISTAPASSSPFSLVIHPSGRFLYCVNRLADSVSSYSINATTGELTPIGGFVGTGRFPQSIAIDPRGRFVFVANSNSSTLYAYAVDPTTGLLTLSDIASTKGSPRSISVDPNGKYLLVAGEGGTVATHAIDESTGALSPPSVVMTRGHAMFVTTTMGPTPVTFKPRHAFVTNGLTNNIAGFAVNANTGAFAFSGGGSSTSPFAVTTDPAGRFAYVTRSFHNFLDAFRIDAATGLLTPVPGAATGPVPGRVHVDPSGRFAYVANSANVFGQTIAGSISAYTIDAATGSPLPMPNGNYITGLGTASVTVDPTGQFLYAANARSNTITAFKINRLTGELGVIEGSPFPNGGSPSALVIEGSGRFLYVANFLDNTVSAYAIQPRFGSLVAVPGGPFPGGGTAMATDPFGRFVLLAQPGVFASGILRVLRIDQSNGALTPAGTSVSIGSSPARVSVDPGGRFVYVVDNSPGSVQAFDIDATGTLTPVAGSPFNAGGGPSMDIAITEKIE